MQIKKKNFTVYSWTINCYSKSVVFLFFPNFIHTHFIKIQLPNYYWFILADFKNTLSSIVGFWFNNNINKRLFHSGADCSFFENNYALRVLFTKMKNQDPWIMNHPVKSVASLNTWWTLPEMLKTCCLQHF